MGEKIGCLIIHGFAGTVDEVAPLAAYLSEKGYATHCPSLKGHTGRKRDLARVSCTEWVKSAEEGFLSVKSRCDRMVIIGFSMGGLIAVNLAVKYKPDAVVTLNMPIRFWDIKRIAQNILEDFKAGDFKNLREYGRKCFDKPLSAMVNFTVLLENTKPLLKDVACPIFIGQGLLDDTTHYKSAEYIRANTGGAYKRVKYYKNSRHPICLDVDCRQVFTDVEDFIRDVVNFVNT